MTIFKTIFQAVYQFLWGDLITLPLPGGSSVGLSLLVLILIPSGIYFTLRTKFLPFRLFPEMLKITTEKKSNSEKNSISGVQALIISTATRVGMGNLVGVVAAISAGGAGAVFWMWVTALLGSSTAFVEATLAQIYKEKDPLYGGYRGGPAYYIHHFFVKKDSISGEKLTDEVINGYFDVLKSPEKKYKKGKTRELYGSVKEKLGEVDSELLERIRKIVLERQAFGGIDFSKKDYCKLFFVWENEDKTRAVYQQEGIRYLLPNLYNSNDFNRKQDGKILGLPNNNMGMNSKKPYLHHYSRKVTVPYLLDQDETLLQMQLFDYLSGFAAKDKVNVYVCPDDAIRIKAFRNTEEPPAVSGGYYLRLKKGKEVEIHDWDIVCNYEPELERIFQLKNLIHVATDEEKGLSSYEKSYTRLWEIRGIIDQSFFQGRMTVNFFTAAKDLDMGHIGIEQIFLENRRWLFAWFWLGQTNGVETFWERMTWQLIRNALQQNSENVRKTVKRQLNVRWSLLDYFHEDRGMEERMNQVRKELKQHLTTKEEWDFSSKDEFCYAAGQMAAYLLDLSQGNSKPCSWLNSILEVKTSDIVKSRLYDLFRKYNYKVERFDPKYGKAVQLIGHIMGVTDKFVIHQEMVVAGFMDSSLIYEKSEKAVAQENRGEKK